MHSIINISFRRKTPHNFTTVSRSGKVGPLNLRLNITSVFVPIDRPKSVRNGCVIERFNGVVIKIKLALCVV